MNDYAAEVLGLLDVVIYDLFDEVHYADVKPYYCDASLSEGFLVKNPDVSDAPVHDHFVFKTKEYSSVEESLWEAIKFLCKVRDNGSKYYGRSRPVVNRINDFGVQREPVYNIRMRFSVTNG